MRIYSFMQKFLAISALGLAISCGSNNGQSTSKDLNPGPNSNIAIPGLDSTVNINDVSEINILPNTLVPKGTMVYLYGGQKERFNNWDFVIDLYMEMHEINVKDQLVSTIGVDKSDTNAFYNQEVTLVVMHDFGRSNDYNSLVAQIEKRVKTEYPSYNGKLFIAPMETKERDGSDLWVQDFGEFGSAMIDGQTDPVYAVIDTYRNQNRDHYSTEVFRDLFGIPLVKVGVNTDHSGQYGGNIEALENGTLYMGNSIDDGFYSADRKGSHLFETLKKKGNSNAIKLSSNWLSVGHVDEFLTIIPSQGSCDTTLVYASPLLSLQMMLDTASATEFDLFAEELAELFIGYGKGGQIQFVETRLTKLDIINALQKFLVSPKGKPTGSSISTEITDYNPAKVSKNIAELVQKEISYDAMMKIIRNKQSFAEFYIWRNLVAEVSIQGSLVKLNAERECQQVTKVPGAFLPNIYVDYTYRLGIWTRDSAHLPGVANALILRDHVIMPDPWVESFRTYIQAQLKPHLGDEDNVHFVDDTIYHFALGEVHCGTNTIREMDMPFKF